MERIQEQVGGVGGCICKQRRKERLCVCILNLNPPSFHLILIILPIPAVRAGTAAAALEIFPLFNEMFRFLHLPLPPYLLGFISTSAPPHSPHPSSHRPSFPPSFLPSCIVFGLSFLSLSVILLGKVIKGRHIEGALLRRVILFSRALPPFFFVSYFCLQRQTLSGGGGSGGVMGEWSEISPLWFFVVK